MIYAYPILGRSGLGNMLFPWARAEVFCRQTGAKMIAPAWSNPFRIGPIIRREHDKRYYLRSFTRSGYIKGLKRLYLLAFRKPVIFVGKDKKNPFKGLHEHRAYIKQRLLRIVHPRIRYIVGEYRSNFIGAHIRRGDFGKRMVPDDFYIKQILSLKKRTFKRCLIFSDGTDAQLEPFLKHGMVVRGNPAIADMLLLAKGDYFIGTPGSTFSAWAEFFREDTGGPV